MVVATIAILAGVGFAVMSPTQDTVKNVKLRSDVQTLNASVQTYLANGGSMDSVTTIAGALTKLKTEADGASSAKLVGLKGAMLDPRFEAEMMDASEAATTSPRALWSTERQRFVFATAGASGAKKFFINQAASSEAPAPEARETCTSYGTVDKWVWDYSDHSLAPGAGVAHVGTSSPSASSYNPLPAAAASPLAPPSFSKEPGLYNYYDFDLAVELTNPNPTGTSNLYYSIEGNQWRVYTGGSVMVGANQSLVAYAVSMDPDNFVDSFHNEAHYGSSFTISGSAGGDFFDPEGPEGMVTNLVDGESGNYFTFGTAVGTPDPSWLLFNGADFADVGADDSFLLGTLDYYNGTIQGGTQAVSVGLSIDLDFAGTSLSFDFGYEFDLISTPNLDGNTPEESADFVKLDDLYSGVPVDLGGASYSLILEFGETTDGGFSSIDEFHVLEGAAATGNLYGRLVEVTEED